MGGYPSDLTDPEWDRLKPNMPVRIEASMGEKRSRDVNGMSPPMYWVICSQSKSIPPSKPTLAKDGKYVIGSQKSMSRSKPSVVTKDTKAPPSSSSRICWDCDWI